MFKETNLLAIFWRQRLNILIAIKYFNGD